MFTRTDVQRNAIERRPFRRLSAHHGNFTQSQERRRHERLEFGQDANYLNREKRGGKHLTQGGRFGFATIGARRVSSSLSKKPDERREFLVTNQRFSYN